MWNVCGVFMEYGVWSSMCFIKQDCWVGIGNDSVKFL